MINGYMEKWSCGLMNLFLETRNRLFYFVGRISIPTAGIQKTQ